MNIKTLSTYYLGDIIVRYQRDEDSGIVGLDLFPAGLEDELATRRLSLRGTLPIDKQPGDWSPAAFSVDPLVHCKIAGDGNTSYFGQGRTMRQAPSTFRFKYRDQRHDRTAGVTQIVTTLDDGAGLSIEHRLVRREGDDAIQISSRFLNETDRPVSLEMITSFDIGGITQFAHDDAPGRLRVHRFRSVWSAEGRLDTQTVEALHLEPSWSAHGVASERFGQVGTMPVRGWFPFVAAEDTVAGVCWGAQLAWAGSWQMEAFRKDDQLCLSGGLADREFGHWLKTVAPGETFSTPTATVSTVKGDLDELCDRLTRSQRHAVDRQPAIERDLPIVFNEWCTTWGKPSHARMISLAKRLQGSHVKYIVMDDGWYRPATSSGPCSIGDWIPDGDIFPQGLAAMAAEIRRMGYVPGIWCEMETVGAGAEAFQRVDLQLKRDGAPITVGERRFWDLNNARTVDYLTERVIDLLDRCGFGYLKVDYNETIGFGCDGAESPGEGLRRQAEASQRFFDKIRSRLPDLVIENCASGGHRLEPSMLARTAMSSFSDSHEGVEIPVIAANLHSLMLPRQSQIWAVLHHDDDDRRLVYSLAATFLGRMCLSGDVDRLDERQMEIVRAATGLYLKAAPIIRDGRSRRTGESCESWRHPRGWQAVTRVSDDLAGALVVVHAFEDAPPSIEVPLPGRGSWRIDAELRTGGPATLDPEAAALAIPVDGDFSGRAIVLSSSA